MLHLGGLLKRCIVLGHYGTGAGLFHMVQIEIFPSTFPNATLCLPFAWYSTRFVHREIPKDVL